MHFGLMVNLFSQISRLHPIDQAAVLIEKAANGEIIDDNIFVTTLERDFSQYRRKYHSVFRFAAWGLIFCELFRRPSWTYRHKDWQDRDRYPVSNLFFIHDGYIVLISVICLILLGTSLLLDAGHEVFSLELDSLPSMAPSGETQKLQGHVVEGHSVPKLKWKFKTNPKGNMNRIIFFVLFFVFVLKLSEVLFTLLALMLSAEQYSLFRSFPLSTFSPVEGIFLILIEKQYRNLLIVILRTLPRFLTLLAFLGIGLFLYTILALRIFDPKSTEAEEYFPSIEEGIWSLLTILNASNWPDPVIPAFQDSQLYFLFFFSFLVIGSWGLLNASSGLVFTFFRDQQQQIRSEITMATFNLISRSYDLLSSNSTLNPTNSSSSRKFDGIPIDLFTDLIRAHSWRFPPLKGLRKPLSSSDSFLANVSESEPLEQKASGATGGEFEKDLNMLLLLLWRTYQNCHTSDLCSAQYSSLSAHFSPTLPSDSWTEKWREKFDVPPELSLVDLSPCENSELMRSVRKLIGGCSCSVGGPFSQHPEVGDRIPQEMFLQFFLVAILKADSDLFDLSSIALSPSQDTVIAEAGEDLDLPSEGEGDAESKLSKMSFSLLSSEINTQLLSTPPTLPRGDSGWAGGGIGTDSGSTRGTMLKRKSRRFFTAVTDVFVSPVVKPIYFNEGWRQCWLASRFLYRERPPREYFSVHRPHSGISHSSQATGRFLNVQWWQDSLERIVGSQEFDILTDAMFATVMVLFLGFFPSVGLMVTWTLYAVLETSLRFLFKGIRRVQRSMRDSSDAFISLLMVLILFVYLVSGDYRHDNSFQIIRDYSLPARRFLSSSSSSSSSDQRAPEVVMFQGLLTLRGIFMLRNLFVIPGMKKLRSRLKTAIRRCLQGASDVLFLILMLFTAAFIFAVLGTKSFGGLIQTNGDTTYPSLSESPYGQSNYYVLNFNDNISSLGTLYILLLVNNMHVIASGFTAISYDVPVKTFFVCWYVLGVLFLLNLLTASLLSSFLSFWVLQKKIIYETKTSVTGDGQGQGHGEMGQGGEMNPLLEYDPFDEKQEGAGQRQRSESFDSHQSSSFLRHGSEVSSFLTSHVDPQESFASAAARGGRERGAVRGRGRSQTVTLNSTDDMFHWFSAGSTGWDGEHINIAQSNPGYPPFSPLLSSPPIPLSEEFKQQQQQSAPPEFVVPHVSLRDTQVASTAAAVSLQHDLSTLASLPPQSLPQRPHKPLQLINHIPFSNTLNEGEDGDGSEEQDEEDSRNLSDESFRGEATLRLSTQFIDSRKENEDSLSSRAVYRPRGMTTATETSSGTETNKPRTLARQWKIWLTETHESITVSEYAALLLHSARRGRQRHMFFTLSAHEAFKLRHRFGWIFLGASWSLFLLSFISRPSWTFEDNASSKYRQEELYPTANLPMISATASAIISLFMVTIVTIGILLEIKYMSQHEVISKTLPSDTPSPAVLQPHGHDHGHHHQHHHNTHNLLQQQQQANDRDRDQRGSECSVGAPVTATRGVSVSRRSLSSTGSTDGPAIQISFHDPASPSPSTSVSASQNIPSRVSRILQFLSRNFWRTNYFLQISWKRLFRLFFIFLNIVEIYFILSFLISQGESGEGKEGGGGGGEGSIRSPSQLERFSAWLSVVFIFWFDYESATSLQIILSSALLRRFLILLLLFGLFILISASIGTYDYHLNDYSINMDDSITTSSSSNNNSSSWSNSWSSIWSGRSEWSYDSSRGSDSESDSNISHDNYFSSFHISLWTIFTSISTTSIPDQVIPYYSDSRSTFVFFFLYLSIGNFLFLNLVLIFIMAEYNTALQQTQRMKSYQRNHNIKMAFEVLDVYHRGCLSYSQVYDLLNELYKSYPEFRGRGGGGGGGTWHWGRLCGRQTGEEEEEERQGGGWGWLSWCNPFGRDKIPSMNEMAVLVAALDVNGDNFIYEEQFMWILHLTQIVIQEKVQGHYLESISPSLLRNPLFHRLFNFIGSRKYCCAVDFILLLLASICLVNDESISSTNPLTDKIRLTIALCMISDILLQISVLGPFRYITLQWSKLNLFIALAMTGVSLYIKTTALHQSDQLESAHICSSIICITRVFLFIRNLDYLFSSIQVSLFFATIKRIFKSLTSLLVSFTCITYLFALAGTLLYGGLINKDPTRSQYSSLQTTAYGDNDYYSLNFNSVPSGVITLICLLRVSGWDIFAIAFAKVTHPAARVYFVLWYLIGVLFLMNIVATLFISGFVVEAATSSSTQQHTQQRGAETAENNYRDDGIPPSELPGKTHGTGVEVGMGNALSECLLSQREEFEAKGEEKSSSSLRQLANRLSQFMSPLSATATATAGADGIPYRPPPLPSPLSLPHSSSSSSSSRPPVPTSTSAPSSSWNPDISRLTKGSSIREITTAQEGGKFYTISLPKYAQSGGNLSVDGGMVTGEEEVNKKFIRRIHSLYSQDGEGDGKGGGG